MLPNGDFIGVAHGSQLRQVLFSVRDDGLYGEGVFLLWHEISGVSITDAKGFQIRSGKYASGGIGFYAGASALLDLTGNRYPDRWIHCRLLPDEPNQLRIKQEDLVRCCVRALLNVSRSRWMHVVKVNHKFRGQGDFMYGVNELIGASGSFSLEGYNLPADKEWSEEILEVLHADIPGSHDL